MRKGDKKIFSQPGLVNEMINLRTKQDWSIYQLAAHYNCDPKAIIYQLKKHDVYCRKDNNIPHAFA